MSNAKDLLTPRERQILIRARFTNRQIATEFGISHQTVKNHFTHIYRKLCPEGFKGRIPALIIALRTELITLDDIL